MTNISRREEYVRNLEDLYAREFSKSKEVFDKGTSYYPNHVSHTARLFKPFPPFIKSAYGSIVTTVDGVDLLDFWQGHFSNILGHNHPVLIDAMRSALDNKLALQSGFLTPLENELASILEKTTGLESFIFTTSGTLSTMYAIMLGLAHTKKEIVLKLEGGWHGAHPWSLIGVKYPEGTGTKLLESAGLPKNWTQQAMTVPINDIDAMRKRFEKHGNEIGVFIVELVLGNSGMIMATKEFIQEARRLTEKYRIVFVIDEIVTGFRVHAGGFYKLYDIDPDIVTFGKAITGGMPFACIAGKKEILAEASVLKRPRVWADGGTFSCHPASLTTAITMIRCLAEHEQEIYPSIINNMNVLRNRCRKIMSDNNIDVDITGESNDDSIPNFPIGTIRFIKDRPQYDRSRAIHHWNADVLDIDLRDRISRIVLMLKGVYTWQGLGVVTNAHTTDDIDKLILAYQDIAADLKDVID